jgi:hypothetical protein
MAIDFQTRWNTIGLVDGKERNYVCACRILFATRDAFAVSCNERPYVNEVAIGQFLKGRGRWKL